MAKSNAPAPAPEAGAITKDEDGFASMFVSEVGFKAPEGTIVKSMSPLLKPAQFPVGKVLVGVFQKLFQTTAGMNDDNTPKFGTGVEIIPAGAPVGVALPATSTIVTGLEIIGVGKAATSQFLGRTVAIKLLPNKIPSKKGQDAWNYVIAIYPEVKNAIK